MLQSFMLLFFLHVYKMKILNILFLAKLNVKEY